MRARTRLLSIFFIALAAASARATPSCERLAEPTPAKPGQSVVTDAEASLLMAKRCKVCHANLGEFGAWDAFTATLGLSSMAGLFLHRRGDPAVAATSGRKCLPWYRRLTSTRSLLWMGTLFGLGHTAMIQAFRVPHTHFLHRNGELDPKAFAVKRETLRRLRNQVEGVDGEGFMPPRNNPFDVARGPFTAENTRQLTLWLAQLQAVDLPGSCQIYLPPTSDAEGEGFAQASKACAGAGMYLPTAAQIAKLRESGQLNGIEGCLWTSSFSETPGAPREKWDVKTGKAQSAGEKSRCLALCLR